MSIKRMVTKLALAFAAKKGMEAFRGAGGMAGVKEMLAGRAGAQGDSRGGMSGRVGQALGADSGGLGNILGSLGRAGTGGGRESGATGQISENHQSLGSLFGALASVIGNGPVPSERKHPLDSEFQMEDIQHNREAEPIVRAMVQMARADGQIDDQEKAALFDILHDASPAEQATLQSALEEPINPNAVAGDTPPHARKEVYTAALLVGDPTHPDEGKFLRSLASALRLTSDEVSSLHKATQKPAFA